MKALCLILLATVCLTAAAPASAQVPSTTTPRVELYGGGSVLFMKPGSDLDRTVQPGAQVSLTVSPFADNDGWLRRLGFAVEAGGARHTSTLDNALVPSTKVRLTETTLLAGPTFATLHRGRVSSQFRALFGTARVRSAFPTDLDQAGIAPGQLPSSIGVFEDEQAFAASIGSAWDIRITRAIAVRINQGTLLTRFAGRNQFSPRVSTGIVFRWYGSDTAH